MRILFVTTAYPASAHDARGVFIHRLACHLVQQGATVTVLAPSAPGVADRDERDGVAIHRAVYWTRRSQALTSDHSGIMPRLQQRPWLLAQVPMLAGSLGLKALRLAAAHDVVHAHWMYPAGVAGLLAARRHGRPLVVTSHGTDLHLTRRSAVLRQLVRMIARAADVSIGVSHAMVEQLEELGAPSERTRFIPLGVGDCDGAAAQTPDAIVSRRSGDRSAFRVIFVGALTRNKSVDTLIRACIRLHERGRRLMLTLVGSGPEESALRLLAARLPAGSVAFLGARPPHEIPGLLAEADALVLPSRMEARGLVLVEAMALGKAVVASDIPGPRELVREDETGLLFPAGDSERLAEQLRRLQDPQLRERLGRAARALVDSEGLTMHASAERHLQLYASLLKHATR